MPRKRIAYVVNNAAFFVSHRLPVALASRNAGHDIRLFIGRAGSITMEEHAVKQLDVAQVKYHRVIFRGAGLNPFFELLGILQLIWLMIKFKPDIVHCASPKGVLYGGVVARLCGVPALVLAISGMGYAYTDIKGNINSRKLIRIIYSAIVRFSFLHPNVRVIVQNQDDYKSLVNSELVKMACVALIRGSGVDLSLFVGAGSLKKMCMVVLPARMLKDKGVVEFVEAAQRIKAFAPNWRFVLAGAAGYDNPSAISVSQLQEWVNEGCVEWLGHVDDMTTLFREAAIVCLPSYREGMPKALLEAAAAGCAVVTTDVIGCREAIKPGLTGDLVPVRDSKALAKALLSLISDDQRRHLYGTNGQEMAKAMFSITSVVSQTIEIYKGILGDE